MPGGALVEEVLGAQLKCLESHSCAPQVAYVEGTGEIGSSEYHFSEPYERTMEVARVDFAGREVPADCRQKGPPPDPPADGRVLDRRPRRRHAVQCPLHGVPLSEGLVPIEYGRGAEDEGILDESLGVPLAVDFVAGGCVVGDNDPNVARVLFCEVCREMKRARGR
jgi:hypothetical protein